MKSVKRNPLLVVGLGLALTIASCSKPTVDSLYVPTAADATATATLADLQAGRNLYISNCERCHNFYLPEKYSAAEWKNHLPGMTSKTSLTSAEILQLTKYATKGK
jgi:cytochrome c5